MKPFVRSFFALLCLSAITGVGCDDSLPVAPLNDGRAGCKEMEELCHEPAERLHGFYEECHETGHAKVGSKCLDIYDRCIEECRAASEALGGAGGESGAGHQHAGGAPSAGAPAGVAGEGGAGATAGGADAAGGASGAAGASTTAGAAGDATAGSDG